LIPLFCGVSLVSIGERHQPRPLVDEVHLIAAPLDAPDFLDAVSRQLNRAATPSKQGRKPKAARA
jgi:hypothetical protein